MVPHTDYNGLYINGEWVKPASGETEEVLNPATEEVIGLCPIGGAPGLIFPRRYLWQYPGLLLLLR